MASNTRPEWLNSVGFSQDGAQRQYLVHLSAPRFTVRIVDVYPDNKPIEEEGEVELTSFVCVQRPRSFDSLLCEPDWIDEVPSDARGHWLRTAARALQQMDESQQFMRWKSLRPVKHMARRIGLDISDCASWSDYAEAFYAEQENSNGGLIERARREFHLLSTGEAPVLTSMLYAAEYSHLADDIGGNNCWRRMADASGDHAEAIALAITRQ